MARRQDAGRGQLIPGLSAALAARESSFDAKFCLAPFGAPCGWCERRDLLLAGRPVTVTGEAIWRALFNPAVPRVWGEFMLDESWYVVTGDRFESVS